MRKIIISIVSLIAFLLFKDITLVKAATDLSNNFTQIELNRRGQVVHVEAMLDDHGNKFQDGDTMAITWKSSNNQLKARGITQTKDLLINKSRIGTYTVNDDHVLLKFNANAENYSDIEGKISFDVQVDNLADIEQRLMFYAGNSTKSILIAPQNPISAQISGKLTQNNIAWKIQINPDPKLSLKSLILENTIPSNLALNKQSLRIQANGKSISNDAVKATESGLIIDLNDYLNQVITIEYDTKVLNSNATLQPNILKLNYQIESDKNTQTESYEGWVNGEAKAFLTGVYNADNLENNNANKQKVKEKISQVLTKLLKLTQDENKAESQTDAKVTESTTKTVSLPQIKASGLTGFDSANVKTDDKAAANKIIKAAVVAKDSNTKVAKLDSEKADSAKSKTHSAKSLPRAGERSTRAISLLGITLFLIGCVGFKVKFFK